MAPSSGARRRRLRLAPLLLPAALCLLTSGLAAAASGRPEPRFSFTSALYNASIYENNVGKEYVVSAGPMGVRLRPELAGADIRYKIVGGDPDGFFKAQQQTVGDFCFLRVRTRTGHADVLNRERQAEFRLKVRAVERGRRRYGRSPAFAEVRVRVLDRNDLNPWFDAAEYDVEVAEDLPVHGLVTQLHADDADEGINGQVYYSLLESEPHFAIEPSSGRVTLARRLSHRQRPEFQLTAVARDRGLNDMDVPGLARLRVRVRPVNLFDPVMHVTHLAEVVEHSSMDVYAIVHVIDRDEGVHGQVAGVRIVDGDPERRFRVLSGTTAGEFLVGVADPLDRESAPYGFNLTLNATDRGTPPRSSFLSVRVRVMDFNDHAPAFTREVYDVTVRETALAHTALVRLRASDSDHGVNAQVRYAIAAGNEGGEFAINAATGLLWLARPLDAETKAFYALTVSALDQGHGGRQRQGSARVTVTVLDENDNAPRFGTPNTQAAVDENEPAEHYVTRVTAEDADQSENAFLSYSIANTEPVPFVINHFDGTITTSEMLDYETQRRQYVLRVRVSDWGKPYRWQTETTVTVRLRNVNDNRPQFEKVDCHGRLSRRAAVGTEIMVLSAIDFDEGAVVSYRLVSGNEDGCFRLDERLGSLRVNCDLADLASDERRLGVMANDGQHFSDETRLRLQLVGSGERPLGGASVRLECKDTGVAGRYRRLLATAEQNNRPRDPFTVVSSSRYGTNYHRPQLSAEPAGELEVSEAAPLGAHLTTVIGHDKDLGFNGLLVFAIADGDDDSAFSIDMDGGNVSVACRLDRERTALYRLNVTACDRGRPQLCASLMLVVHVLDVNDNAPRLERSSFTFFYPETRPAGQPVVRLNASDPDEGANGRVSFKLLTDTADFAVDQHTGLVSQVRALDRERQSSYRLRVAARDGSASRPLVSHAVVHVDVLDVNDNAPRFSRPLYQVRASEDLPVGAVLVTLDAVDPDRPGAAEPVSYQVTAGGHGRFGVDRRSGAVRLLEPLDFEQRQIYNVTVEARDDGSPPLSAVAYLVVQVVDVNENYFAPSFGGAVAVRGSVLEGRPSGTFVLAVRATDADPAGPNSDLTYSIRGGSGVGHFSINETGIYTRDVLDRETQSSYWLTVYAKDSGAVPLSARLEVYIEVEDENDNYPLTSEPVYRAEVLENSAPGTRVTRVTASDRDGAGPLRYRIAGGNPQSLFSMDPDTGVITTTERVLDRETRDAFTLEVTVSDWGAPALTSTARVMVTVLDENDSPPVFSERLYRVQVPLGPALSRPNASIFQVIAHDEDAGVNSELRYSIVSTDGLRLTIEPRLGQLRLPTDGAPIAAGKHQLTVRATDGGKPVRSSVARVLLTVLEEGPPPPHPPRVDLPERAVQVFETDPVGHLVILATANATLLFSIAGGNTGGSFSVNSQGGIVIARPLDWETTAEYTLNVSATDGHHVVFTPLRITVLDVNDRDPAFERALYAVNVSEAAEPGDRLLTVSAADPDGEALLYYGLEAAQSDRSLRLFSIDPMTGQVTVAGRLDRETEHEHVLTVSVRDQGTPARRDYARLLVHVRDENDHRPQFLSDLVVGQVHETAPVGWQVVTVLATDRDHGQNARITYSILSGNVDNAFAVDSVLGTISVAIGLDQRRASEYILTVRASDAGRPPLHGDVHVNVLVTLPDNAPPRFEKAEYGAEVEEDRPPGSHVLDVVAHCRTSVTYRLVGGNEDGSFLLNPGAGVLTVSERLDYERRTWYNLSIQAVSMVGEVAHMNVIIP
ncbi:fat-like cadherin-related tumor suppressor homolog [Pollicipes pollicipes]|uniref:fat-like cadherin-related tumor suppressor homolog n=1 Tax=Pollicipes pollicipes TaxID=41117 RepID=UPI001884FC0F|nr:fat-like cadherin-related tumor suppressor homolog [Pollicipes pollicipes]